MNALFSFVDYLEGMNQFLEVNYHQHIEQIEPDFNYGVPSIELWNS
jgi:hypothetical protein